MSRKASSIVAAVAARFEVVLPLEHDQVRFEAGATLQLPDAVAQPLVDAGVLRMVSAAAPADLAPDDGQVSLDGSPGSS